MFCFLMVYKNIWLFRQNRFDLLHNLHTKPTTNIGLINQTKKYSEIKFSLKRITR